MSKVQGWLLANDHACRYGSQLFPLLFFSLAPYCTCNDSDPIWSHVSRSCTAGNPRCLVLSWVTWVLSWPLYRFRSDDGSCSGIRSIFYLSPTRFSTNPRRRISACMPFTIKASCMQKNRSFMPFGIAHAIRKFKTIWWNQQNSKPDPHSHDCWTFQLSNCDFLRWSLVVAQSIFSPKLEIAHSGLLKFLEVTKVCT